MERWWGYTCLIPRDQIWLPLVLTQEWRKRVFTITEDIFNNPWFEFRGHNR